MTTSDASWLSALRGRFVVFDGPDGSGKSTQFRRFAQFAEQGGLKVCHVREPGGTEIGEQVRKLLLEYRDDQHGHMDVNCEMLLFMASRAQLIAERIAPARQRGELVLADRFISSTLAYQGAAGGMSLEAIRRVGEVALGKHWPDLVVVFDVDEQTAASRLSPLLDRMEQKGADYHAKVRHGYLDQAKADPDHYAVVDARADEATVFERLVETLKTRMGTAG